jgi:hypothetical protein
MAPESHAIDSPERCREVARQCRQQAASAGGRPVARMLIDVAEAYDALALKLDRLDTLGID